LTRPRPDYREVVSIADAVRQALDAVGAPPGGVETVPLDRAAGRVLAEDVEALENVPGFDRSTVDGYAVSAADTYGAGEAAPVLLVVAGEVEMGRPAGVRLAPGQAAAVPTGGMLPGGADAVVMVEHTTEAGKGLIEVHRPVAPGENVVRAGEDVARGERVLRAGRRLSPVDLGVLAATGVTRVAVRPRPRAAVIPTGDEIVPASSATCHPGQVRDITSAALAAMVSRDGGEAAVFDVVSDEAAALREAVGSALAKGFDLILILGGSSVGARDHTASVIDGFGPPGIVFHGLALKPGKPTIFGACRRPGEGEGLPASRTAAAPVFGLPGHPVSSLVVYRVLVRHVLRLLAGEMPPEWQSFAPLEPAFRAVMARAVPSDQGREDYLCVTLRQAATREPGDAPGDERGGGQNAPVLEADPVPGKSGLITMLARADGLVRIPAGQRGLPAGTEVEVYPI